MSYVLDHLQKNIWRGRFDSFPEDVAVHGISARLGGVSTGSYDSLNLGLHVQDDADKVRENRRRFLAGLGLNAQQLVTPEQVHGIHVARVGKDESGRGAKEYGDCIPQTDALITNEPGLPLLLCFADCTPILFVDTEKRAVGIAHAGWKGTVGRIAQATVLRMEQEFDTDPTDLLVGIGPAIGPCCYEVGENVAAKFAAAFPGHEQEIIHEQDGKPHVDLWQANMQALLDAGVPRANIDRADTCTACQHKWYFSYRADGGRTGRLGAVIALR